MQRFPRIIWLIPALLLAGFLASGCQEQPDALSEEDRERYCKDLVAFVSDNQAFTAKLEEDLASRFGVKSQFASRAYWVYGYVDESGRIAIMPEFMQAEPFTMNFARTKRIGQSTGFIDHSGQTVIGPGFANARRFTYGLSAVQLVRNGPWGYMDDSGKMVIEPQFNTAHEFVDARARVEKDDMWGYIDVKGKLAVPLKFDRAEDFHGGEAIVKKGKLWYKIDRFGKQTTRKTRKKPSSPADKKHSGPPEGYNGLTPFNEGGEIGYKNATGQVIIKPQFDSGDYFSEGLALVGFVCTPPEPGEKEEEK